MFSNKTVMITGANGGLGRVVSQRFVDENARVILVGRGLESVEALAEELGESQSIPVAIQNLADPDEVSEVMSSLENQGIKIDVLIHTVGGYAAGTPVHETDLDLFARMMNMNTKPILVTGGQVAKHMLNHNIQGKIVAILARNAFKAVKNSGAYSASKAAAQRLIETMAIELRDSGINVNAIAPSILDNRPNRESMPNADFSKWVTYEQITNSCVFLASENASAYHGTTLEIYGRS